jgi:hypothetical protein
VIGELLFVDIALGEPHEIEAVGAFAGDVE